MMTKEESQAWLRQEFEKIRSPKDAKEFMKQHRTSMSYYDSPSGQTQARLQPHMRQARFDLAQMVREKFNLK